MGSRRKDSLHGSLVRPLPNSTMGLDELAIRRDDPEEDEPEEGEEEDEELVDPMEAIKDACINGHHCSSFKEKFETCNDRVTSREQTEETCSEELFDLLHCVDHCMSKPLFSKLK